MRLPSGEIAGELTVVSLYQSLSVNARAGRASCATTAKAGSSNGVVARRKARIGNLRWWKRPRILVQRVARSLPAGRGSQGIVRPERVASIFRCPPALETRRRDA